MKLTAAMIAALAAVILVAGCGGGGGGGPTGVITGAAVAAGTNAPLQGVLVTVVENGKTTTTDAQGSFTLTLAPGDYTLRLTKTDYELRERPVAVVVGDNPPLGEITMVPTGASDPPDQTLPRTIEGKALLSGQTNHSGITVDLLEGTTVLETKTTGTDGSYSFWIWAGSYTIRFTKAGYTQTQTTATVVNMDQIVQVPNVTLQNQ